MLGRLLRAASAALLICSTASTGACSSVERSVETHTTHFIDAGEGINNGAKVLDDRPVAIVVYRNGAVVGAETRPVAGMVLFTPNRARQLSVYADAIDALLTEAPDAVRDSVEAAVRTAAAKFRETK